MGERKRYLELWVPLEVGPAIPAPPIEPYSGLIGENIKVCSGITGAEIEIRLVSAPALKFTSQILGVGKGDFELGVPLEAGATQPQPSVVARPEFSAQCAKVCVIHLWAGMRRF